MEEEKNEDKSKEKDFLSYNDDDGSIKNQNVIIIKEDAVGVSFKFNLYDSQSIFIPWQKVNKIKRREK